MARRNDAERLAFLRRVIGDEALSMKRWTLVWGGLYASMTIAQIAVTPLFESQDQVDWWIGAATTAVGVAFAVFDEPQVLSRGDEFLRRSAQRSSVDSEVGDIGDVCALIAQGEAILFADAEREAASVRWYMHVANAAFSVAAGLVLGLGFNHWESGGINAGVGVALGEATILTSPTALVEAARAYREGGSALAASGGVHWTLRPMMTRDGGGLMLNVSF